MNNAASLSLSKLAGWLEVIFVHIIEEETDSDLFDFCKNYEWEPRELIYWDLV